MRHASERTSGPTQGPAPFGFDLSLALFDRVTRLAKSLFASADASIILIHQGQVWRSRRADEFPAEDPVTQQVVASGELLWVEDGRSDPRFADHPLVTGPPFLRFTASTPVRLEDGSTPGVLSVSGLEPQPFDANKAARLKDLADIVADEWARARSAEAHKATVRARNAALERLRESEALYRLLADNQTDVIIRYDPDGRIVFASPSVRQFGYRPEDLVGRNMADFTHPDDAAHALRNRQAVARGAPLEPNEKHEFRTRKADGSWVWLQGSPAPIRDEAGAITGVVTVLRDVSARREMEDALRRTSAEAEAAVRVKSDFLANMTHELRTPLNAIVGFSGVLKEAPDLSPRHARQVELIWNASQTLLWVVNDVLDFSKLEAGAVEFEVDAFDPAAMTHSTVSLLAGQASAKGLRVWVDAAGLEGRLLGDGARLRQVLTNFLSNALKFTAEGEIGVLVEQRVDGERRRLRVAVKDSGIGVAPEHAEAIFTRFSQADASVSRKFGGTGLGLAISKRIIEAMGGKIGVESTPGHGSTFWFEVSLPIAAAAGPDDDFVQPAVHVSQSLRLLVVDDNAVNRELIRTLLEPFDLEIHTAADGVEAIEAASRSPFDVILMDVQMPNMDGLAATRCIRDTAVPGAPRIPIIAMTANILPEQIARCLEAGMDDHIGKPIHPAMLLEKLARWSARDSTADETSSVERQEAAHGARPALGGLLPSAGAKPAP